MTAALELSNPERTSAPAAGASGGAPPAPAPAGLTTALIDARAPGAWLRVGGGPLVQRQVRVLARLGVKRFVLLCPPERTGRHVPAAPRGTELASGTDPAAWAAAAAATPGPVLAVRAEYLIDPRLCEELCRPGPERRLPGALDATTGLAAAALEATRLGAGLGWEYGPAATLPCVETAAIDLHHREQRTRVPLHLREIRTPSEARRATWDLILATQKKVQDLPSEYIDPPFENAITYALCATPVTPNQVTYACFLIAVGIGCLFLNGWFVLGAFLTYLVEWLDGVDGKLARVKLIFSKLGEFESVFDYFYENFWWFSITWATAGLGYGLDAWRAGGLLMAADLVENILVTIWSLRGARSSLDELGPLDARFRRIGGRRNIYCAMFLVGYLAGAPYGTLCAVAAWAVTTATWHSVRLVQNWRRAPGLR
ncbi:MAG: CDP-alcohol phosphatidyltransferase family protein [Planctomycetes bacterium]|nr:CDP-alcohol phosphatidyltransferase family protein [Planctomycetota bacterium]